MARNLENSTAAAVTLEGLENVLAPAPVSKKGAALAAMAIARLAAKLEGSEIVGDSIDDVVGQCLMRSKGAVCSAIDSRLGDTDDSGEVDVTTPIAVLVLHTSDPKAQQADPGVRDVKASDWELLAAVDAALRANIRKVDGVYAFATREFMVKYGESRERGGMARAVNPIPSGKGFENAIQNEAVRQAFDGEAGFKKLTGLSRVPVTTVSERPPGKPVITQTVQPLVRNGTVEIQLLSLVPEAEAERVLDYVRTHSYTNGGPERFDRLGYPAPQPPSEGFLHLVLQVADRMRLVDVTAFEKEYPASNSGLLRLMEAFKDIPLDPHTSVGLPLVFSKEQGLLTRDGRVALQEQWAFQVFASLMRDAGERVLKRGNVKPDESAARALRLLRALAPAALVPIVKSKTDIYEGSYVDKTVVTAAKGAQISGSVFTVAKPPRVYYVFSWALRKLLGVVNLALGLAVVGPHQIAGFPAALPAPAFPLKVDWPGYRPRTLRFSPEEVAQVPPVLLAHRQSMTKGGAHKLLFLMRAKAQERDGVCVAACGDDTLLMVRVPYKGGSAYVTLSLDGSRFDLRQSSNWRALDLAVYARPFEAASEKSPTCGVVAALVHWNSSVLLTQRLALAYKQWAVTTTGAASGAPMLTEHNGLLAGSVVYTGALAMRAQLLELFGGAEGVEGRLQAVDAWAEKMIAYVNQKSGLVFEVEARDVLHLNPTPAYAPELAAAQKRGDGGVVCDPIGEGTTRFVGRVFRWALDEGGLPYIVAPLAEERMFKLFLQAPAEVVDAEESSEVDVGPAKLVSYALEGGYAYPWVWEVIEKGLVKYGSLVRRSQVSDELASDVEFDYASGPAPSTAFVRLMRETVVSFACGSRLKVPMGSKPSAGASGAAGASAPIKAAMEAATDFSQFEIPALPAVASTSAISVGDVVSPTAALLASFAAAAVVDRGNALATSVVPSKGASPAGEPILHAVQPPAGAASVAASVISFATASSARAPARTESAVRPSAGAGASASSKPSAAPSAAARAAGGGGPAAAGAPAPAVREAPLSVGAAEAERRKGIERVSEAAGKTVLKAELGSAYPISLGGKFASVGNVASKGPVRKAGIPLGTFDTNPEVVDAPAAVPVATFESLYAAGEGISAADRDRLALVLERLYDEAGGELSPALFVVAGFIGAARSRSKSYFGVIDLPKVGDRTPTARAPFVTVADLAAVGEYYSPVKGVPWLEAVALAEAEGYVTKLVHPETRDVLYVGPNTDTRDKSVRFLHAKDLRYVGTNVAASAMVPFLPGPEKKKATLTETAAYDRDRKAFVLASDVAGSALGRALYSGGSFTTLRAAPSSQTAFGPSSVSGPGKVAPFPRRAKLPPLPRADKDEGGPRKAGPAKGPRGAGARIAAERSEAQADYLHQYMRERDEEYAKDAAAAAADADYELEREIFGELDKRNRLRLGIREEYDGDDAGAWDDDDVSAGEGGDFEAGDW